MTTQSENKGIDIERRWTQINAELASLRLLEDDRLIKISGDHIQVTLAGR